jgi:putative addiction module component (TIGR02574 family)
MPTTVDELLTAALALSPAEREELADRLWDSLDPPPGSDLDRMTDDEFTAELDRRMAESDRDPSARVPWSQVRDMR